MFLSPLPHTIHTPFHHIPQTSGRTNKETQGFYWSVLHSLLVTLCTSLLAIDTLQDWGFNFCYSSVNPMMRTCVFWNFSPITIRHKILP
jgi:hypothetical protein